MDIICEPILVIYSKQDLVDGQNSFPLWEGLYDLKIFKRLFYFVICKIYIKVIGNSLSETVLLKFIFGLERTFPPNPDSRSSKTSRPLLHYSDCNGHCLSELLYSSSFSYSLPLLTNFQVLCIGVCWPIVQIYGFIFSGKYNVSLCLLSSHPRFYKYKIRFWG